MIDYYEKLSEEQLRICESEKNLLVKACPGSGKTRTIVYKLAYRIEKNPNNIKKLIAITYTNRAADEIIQRVDELGIDTERVWTGTIHQFCLEWILNRYRMYTKSLNQGFKIIDERVKERYLSDVINGLGYDMYWGDINISYDRDLHLIEQNPDKRKVIKAYHQILVKNKELDFEQILVTTYNLLKNNKFIANNIKDCLELICVDEYQDTQDLQYAIIEEIANGNDSQKMQVNFFGDPNQAIYGSLGGVAKSLDLINQEFKTIQFSERTLSGCYRSTKRIIKFYKEFMVDKYDIDAKGIVKDEKGIIKYKYTIDKDEIYDMIAQIIEENIRDGVPEKEICVIAPVWNMLYPFSKRLQDRLPNVKFDAPDITPIKRDPLNVFYKISRLLLTEPSIKSTAYRNKLAKEILEELEIYIGESLDIESTEFLNITISAKKNCEKGSEFIEEGTQNIFDMLHYSMENYSELMKTYEDFIEKMKYRLGNSKFELSDDLDVFKSMFKEKEGVVINTCHGVKGEEYHTVIAFGLLYSKVPSIYTSYDRMDEEANKLLYVIASRAKKRIYLFSEKGRRYRDKGLRQYVDAFPTKQLFQNHIVEYDT